MKIDKFIKSSLFLASLLMRNTLVDSQNNANDDECSPEELFEFTKAGALNDSNDEIVQFEYSLVPLKLDLETDQYEIDESSPGDAETIERGLAGLQMKLEYNGKAWLAVGRPQAERTQMVGAHVVIGRPGDQPGQSNPGKYDIVSKQTSGVELLGLEFQTLIDASISQTETSTILKFTKRLAEDDHYNIQIFDSSKLIWAVGYGNTLSIHKLQGGFTINPSLECRIFKSDSIRVPSTDDAEVPTDIDAPEYYYQYMDDGFTDEPLLSEEYYYQYMDDAYTDDDQVQNSFTMKFMPTQKTLWIVHGVFATIAWGVAAPLAVMAAIFRYTGNGEETQGPNRSWFKIHFFLNMTCIVFTLIALIVALAATAQANANHFDHPHNIVGLVIVIIVILQSLFAFIRPASEIDDKKPMKRTVWEYCHRGMGMVLLGASIWQVYSGLDQFEWHFGTINLAVYIVLYFWIFILVLLNVFGCYKGYFHDVA